MILRNGEEQVELIRNLSSPDPWRLILVLRFQHRLTYTAFYRRAVPSLPATANLRLTAHPLV